MSYASLTPGPETERDRALVRRALEGHLSTVYQPIIDLGKRRVIGYEALLRFRDEHVISATGFSPDALLASAHRIGRSAELEMAAMRSALRARDSLSRDTNLFLNISVAALADERVAEVLLMQGSLDGVVLELHDRDLAVVADLHDSLVVLRDRGAAIAIADPTLRPESLELLMALDPGYIKLDRRLIDGVATSRFKLAIVDSLRHLAETLHMGVIAQGIESLADLQILDRVGITLGQGFLIARPAAIDHPAIDMAQLLDERLATDATDDHHIARLIEPVRELTELELDTPLPGVADVEFEVIVSELREPLALLQHVGTRVQNLSVTLINERTSLREAARVALRRPMESRFDPIVCIDALGTCAGVVRVDRLIAALLREPLNPPQRAHGIVRDGSHRSRRHPRRP